MNIWSVIVVGLQLLNSLVRSFYWRFVCWIFVMIFDLLLMKTFWHLWCWLVVSDDLMFSWYYIFLFSELRNVVWCYIVEFLRFFKFSFFIDFLELMLCCESFSFDCIFVKLQILKLKFCRKRHLFWILNVVGLTFSFSLKLCWKVLFEELPFNFWL